MKTETLYLKQRVSTKGAVVQENKDTPRLGLSHKPTTNTRTSPLHQHENRALSSSQKHLHHPYKPADKVTINNRFDHLGFLIMCH